MNHRPTPCELTKTKNGVSHEKLWSETRIALQWHCPAFSYILYRMLDTVNSKDLAFFTKDVPIAATDGSALLLNPETFFEYNLSERMFVCAHEIMHCIFNHCVTMHGFASRGKVAFSDGTTIPFNQELMNIAADLVINDALVNSKDNAGKQIFQFNKDWLHNPAMGTQNDAVIDVYRKLYKEGGGKGNGQDQNSGGQSQNPCQGGARFDEHLKPGTSQGKDAGQAAADRNPTEWGVAVAAAAAAARAMGHLPVGLERLFNELLYPQVDWREHIQALFARKLGGGSFDWRKPDRQLLVRDLYAPGRSGFGAGTVIVAVDTSGSIGPKELDMFLGEMSGILGDVRPRRLMVAWCDAYLHRVDELEETNDLAGIRAKGAPGGGGTSFIPVFNWIDEEGHIPDALVYLTDGLGSFPTTAPSYPVIWGSILKDSKYPFGDVVQVPHS